MTATMNRRMTPIPTAQVRAAVVDDSVVVRGLLSKWLTDTPGIEVAGTFRSGREIIDALPALQPRIILLDLDMPDMDGITALPLILAKSPHSRVIVVSSLSVHGAELTMRSLMKGATDYLPKPSSLRELSTTADFRQALIAKVLAVGGVRALSRPDAAPASPPASAPAAARSALFARNSASGASAALPSLPRSLPLSSLPLPIVPGMRRLERIVPRVIVIGASTGGPQALVSLFENMPKAALRVPVVIAQHMPPIFSAIFAQHLKQHVGLPAQEVCDGAILRAGQVYLAPGGTHSVIRRNPDGQISFARLPAEARGPWRPSIDLLFSSAAEVFGREALAIALTGMGRDGTEGARSLARAGANIIVQDEDSSVVWGIPGSIVESGLACVQHPPEKLGGLAQALLDGGALQ